MIPLEEYILVSTTVDKKEDADKIAKMVVERRLAACAQVLGPIVSTYWWMGKIETSEEWLILIKSEKSLYDELEKTIKEIHPYKVPEIVALPIIAGSKEYLEWLRSELRSGQRSR